ncbi:MAG: endonuclease/exonuclease/phosphatase family protein [Bacteroidales bacterium]|nr:endonuclease/exonuclease/phosphatase family protein [Bacteroidales bacterium]
MNRNYIRVLLLVLAISLLMASCRKPPGSSDEEPDFLDCIISGTESTFDIVTFNIQEYPRYGEETAEVAAALIKQMNVDIVALQEISSESEFDKLVDRLIGWEGTYYPIDNSIWNLAYLYKVSEISINEAEGKVLFRDDYWSFPRPPFEIHVRHIPTGIEAILINNHLKCCGGIDNEDRRRSATDSLHKYILSTYPDEAVIVLGDLNDEINGTSYETNVFWTMVNDPGNFRFTDMSIAQGSASWWSYPSWPSHIDHICVSDELYLNIDTTIVNRPDRCYPDYGELISDHRPVYLRLKQ